MKKEAVGLRLSCGGKYQDWVVPSVRQAVLDDPFLKVSQETNQPETHFPGESLQINWESIQNLGETLP